MRAFLATLVIASGLTVGASLPTPAVPPCIDRPGDMFNECAQLDTSGVIDLRDRR